MKYLWIRNNSETVVLEDLINLYTSAVQFNPKTDELYEIGDAVEPVITTQPAINLRSVSNEIEIEDNMSYDRDLGVFSISIVDEGFTFDR